MTENEGRALQTLIEMKHIRKDYRLGETVVHALAGVDLSIEQGEFVAIWGPSGSGKTTLLNLMGAIDEPTEGRLSIGGKDVRSLSDNQRSELRNEMIGFIFQGFNLVPVLSALENVMLPLQIKGAGYKEARKRRIGASSGSGPCAIRPSSPLQDVGRAAAEGRRRQGPGEQALSRDRRRADGQPRFGNGPRRLSP